ncbi:DUF4238 domain-containing protein [Aurantimonas aggregata]|uniref:DUF4238 domain-containing protein n=1 Tax=Aurantimonas aggregata TaxID=2047720 RepID=A0A6L9MNG7_9HYPH|nr:DUF4238 domain-containing protein [Aurantimonas aggregata]
MQLIFNLCRNHPSLPDKHHYVTQAQLRHFARDEGRTQIHVFDKTTGKSFTSSILDSGSENDFNTITEDGGRLNFEAMFDRVDDAGAAIVAQIAEHRSLSWIGEQQKVRFGHVGTHADQELSFQNAERFGVGRGKLPMTSIMPPQQWHR